MVQKDLTRELDHLVSLLQPPYREAWRAYVWQKANAMAREFPDLYADLPAALTKRMSSDLSASGPHL